MVSPDLSQAARARASAKGQAMADGRYPIRDKRELAKAILAIGRSKNPQATRQHIVKRARALNAIDMLPSTWNIKA